MCGRYTLLSMPEVIEQTFMLSIQEVWPPRYNIAPTQPIPVIFQTFKRRELRLMRWGFIPDWIKDPADFSLLINARSETAAIKPSFKNAYKHRRCIIPANGFYEWKRNGKQKLPYFFQNTTGSCIGFAGLFETWIGKDGSEIDTACIMTTTASKDISHIHERMPVVIKPEDASTWLDCTAYPDQRIKNLTTGTGNGFFKVTPVSNKINNIKNTDISVQDRREEETKIVTQSSSQLDLF